MACDEELKPAEVNGDFLCRGAKEIGATFRKVLRVEWRLCGEVKKVYNKPEMSIKRFPPEYFFLMAETWIRQIFKI